MLLGACTFPTGPEDARVGGEVWRIDPVPAVFAERYAEAEACLSVVGDFDRPPSPRACVPHPSRRMLAPWMTPPPA